MIGVTSGDVTLLLRALLAAALGVAVGWEREAHGHAAGVRTVSLVALAAAALTTLAQISFGTPDRIIANIIVSVGFLGAGMILRGRMGEARGLTTAAAVWSITIVGMVVGLGHYLAGVLLTGLMLLILWSPYIALLARFLPSPPNSHAADDDDADIHDGPVTHETEWAPNMPNMPNMPDTRRPS